MPGMELLAMGGLGAKAAFNYNRENFMYDRKLRLKKEFQLMNMRVEQAGQWREDVRDLISLTEYKMHVYILTNVLMIGFAVVLWCEGRLPETTPDWMMMGSSLSITGSFIFLVLAVWMAMHAAVAAQGYETRLLTQLVRLPIPTWQELEACRTCASDFEKLDPKQMFRVPFVAGRQEDMVQQQNGAHASAGGQGSARTAADPWGLERSGESVYELGTREGSDVARLRHIKLARQAMVYWQTYDAFARISMSIGVIELLLAMSFYILGYVLVQDSCRSAATYGVALLTCMAESITRMDMSLFRWEARSVQLLLSFTPGMSCVAAYHWSQQSNFNLKLAEAMIVVAFISHGLFLAIMVRVCRITQQDNGTLLPIAFRSVLYLDVFGWLRDMADSAENEPGDGAGLQQTLRGDNQGRKKSALRRASTSWFASTPTSSVWQQASRRGSVERRRSFGFGESSLWGNSDRYGQPDFEADAETGDAEYVLRPATEAVHYDEYGNAVPQRPEDAAPHGAVQDFRHEKGAPTGTFTDDSKAFFSAAKWMQGEASRPAERCVCGNIFMDDSVFCRRCGVKRPTDGAREGDDRPDYEYATGHESHNPGILPWRVFSAIMMLLCLAWLFGGVYHLLTLTNLVEKDEPLIWETSGGSDEPWERRLPRHGALSLSALGHLRTPFSVKVPEHVERLETSWPHENVRPLSLACDGDGHRFVVADRFRTFTAEFEAGGHDHGRGGRRKHHHLNRDFEKSMGRGSRPAAVTFGELECPSLLGEGLLDAAISCSTEEDKGAVEKETAGVCQALVLHRHGRRMSSCPLAAAGGNSAQGAGEGLVANLSDAWLEVSRREPIDDGLTSRSGSPHARIEKTIAFSVDDSCWGGLGALSRRCSSAFAGTSRGRVVQLKQHSQKQELVPAEVIAEGVNGPEPSSLGSGAVRSLGAGFLGILQDRGQTIQVLALNRGGVHAGKIRLPEAQPAVAFCAGGGHLYLLGDGPSPTLLKVPLPPDLAPD